MPPPLGRTDGRHSQGVPQLLVPGLPVPVPERHPAQLASAQPPDWLSAREVLPGRVSLPAHVRPPSKCRQISEPPHSLNIYHLVEKTVIFCVSVPAKDEDGSSCGPSDEALPALPPGFYHRHHLQLPGQGKLTLFIGVVNSFQW